MLVVLMIFCAVGAIFLIGLGAYAEFQDLWAQSGKHSARGHPPAHPHHR